jgi:hypothetical protein
MSNWPYLDPLPEAAGFSRQYQPPPPDRARCAFVLDLGTPRFCDEVAAPGSSYCARHRALCAIPAESPEGQRIGRDLAALADREPRPPAELAHLASVAVPEQFDPDDPEDDVAACLDRASLPRETEPE